MPICISCSTPVKHLYTTYTKAGGTDVRLTQCPNCKRFADKYVEHDFVVLFIDLVLIKPPVYRHLLFNRLGSADDKLDPSILRLGTLLILFDVYITWARIEKTGGNFPNGGKFDSLGEAPIITQYMFFLTLNALATIAQHLTIRLLARLVPPRRVLASSPPPPSSGSPDKDDLLSGPRPATQADNAPAIGPGRASPSAISTALFVSSCGKLFPILLVIWPTQSSEQLSTTTRESNFTLRAQSYVGWAVLLNNIEALSILLDCGYVVASALALAGLVARWLLEGALLSTVGLVGEHGPIEDLVCILSKAVSFVGIG